MADLSPAAREVMSAATNGNTNIVNDPVYRQCIAAALRAAADQVVPEEPLHGGDQRWMYERDTRQDCRKRLLAIAAELEGHA